jgi:hypothetical protein
LIDIVSDAGLFVSAILLRPEETLGKRIAASGGIFSGQQLVDDFNEVTGNKAAYVAIDYKTWGSFLPEAVREDLVGNFRLIGEYGYYVGEPVDTVEQSHKLVAEAGLRKPVAWKEFVAKSFKE